MTAQAFHNRRAATDLRSLALAVAFLLMGGAVAHAQEFLRPLWDVRIDPAATNQPLLADLYSNGIYHVVTSDAGGRVTAYEGTSGRVLWKTSLGAALTDPVCGYFSAMGSLEIAVGVKEEASKGVVLMLASTGQVLCTYPTGEPVIHSPTPFPVEVPADAPRRHALAVIDRLGKLYFLQASVNGDALEPFRTLAPELANRLNRTPAGPPAVGSVMGVNSIDIVLTYEDMIAVFNRDDPNTKNDFFEKSEFFGQTVRRDLVSPPGVKISAPAVVNNVKQNPDIAGRDFDEIVFPITLKDYSFFAILDYDERRRGDLRTGLLNAWHNFGTNQATLENFPGVGGYPRDTLLVSLDTDTAHLGLVATGQREVYGYDAFGNRKMSASMGGQDFAVPPIAILGDGNTSTLLVFPTSGGRGTLGVKNISNLSEQPKPFPLDFVPTRQPVAGELDGDASTHEIVFVTSTKRLACFAAPTIQSRPPGPLSWQCSGGTIYRSGGVHPSYFEELRRQKDLVERRLRAEIELARGALERGDLALARQSIDIVMAINPTLEEARAIASSVFIRENLVMLIVGTIAGLLAAAAIGFYSFRFFTKTLGMRTVGQDLGAGETQSALDHLHRVYQKFPKDPKVLQLLVRTTLRCADWGERSIKPLKEFYARNESDDQVLAGLVRCYVARRDLTQSNFALYKKAEQIMPENPELKYLIGLQYKADNDLKLAQEYLRKAVRLPNPPAEAFDELAQILLSHQSLSAKNAEVFEEAYKRHPQNVEFLRGLALCLIDGKKIDAHAQDLYERMLTHDPSFVPAMIELCKAKIQSGQIDEAVSYANRIQKLDPENTEGVHLLSQCYLFQNRTDETAIRTLRTAAKLFPDDKDIIATLARTYIEQRRTDEEAVIAYRRAFELNRNDPAIAATLAQVASVQKDVPLAIQANEKLIELGQATPRNFQQLAEAYLEIDLLEERAERVFREALRADPSNRKYLGHLARIYCAAGRVDPEALKVYDIAHQMNPTFEIGKQLAKTYFHNDMWEQLTKLAPKLLMQRPDDADLQKLFAQGSLSINRMDEAIVQYEAVLRNNPNDHDALVNLALAYAQKGVADERTYQIYRKALEIQPRSDLLWMMMGRIAISQGQEKDAAAAYRKALAVSESSPEKVVRDLKVLFSKGVTSPKLRWILAELLIAGNRLREASEELVAIFEADPTQVDAILGGYNKILALDPNNSVGLVQRGVMYKAKGMLEEARADLRKAFEINPANADAQRELVDLYQAVLRERDDLEVRHQLGQVHVAMEEYDRAIACFQRSSQDYRFENEAIKALGLCFVQKGLLDLALQEFKKVPVDDEMKDILYDLAQRYETKKDMIGAKTVYKSIFAADIDFRDVRQKFEMLAGSTSDPMVFDKTMIQQDLSLEAQKRYELIDELGRGAMGIVYKAKDNELDEVVALKILPENISNNPEAVKRFRLEARAARRLAHPHIIRIHDIGEEMGRKYISMEYVDGTDLKHKFRAEGPPDYHQLVRWTREICSALDYAHKQGIVHRDIKPANIMLTLEGVVKVADFGIAKALNTADATLTGAVMGTPLYMSPEQVKGAQIDHRADIYSLGIMLYELASGKPPFTEGDLAYQHLNVEPRPLTGVDPSFTQLVMKCLAKDREMRWSSCGEMIEFLQSFARA